MWNMKFVMAQRKVQMNFQKGKQIQERGKQQLLVSVVRPAMLTEKPESEVRSMWVKVSKVSYFIISMNGREIPLELPVRRWVLPEGTRKKTCFKALRYCYFWSRLNLTYLVAQLVKNLPAMQQTWVQSLGWEDPLEKGKAAHSSILAWRIPWTVVHGLQRDGHNWSTFTFTFQSILSFLLYMVLENVLT